MGELGRHDGPADRDPEGDRPAQRPERIRPPGEPLAERFPVDRRKVTPVQREFARTYADNPREADPDRPYSIDWKTGGSADDRHPQPVDDVPDEVSGVHDPIEETRPYGEKGGLNRPDHMEQSRLEQVVPRDADGRPEKFPSLDGEWTNYVNGRGPGNDPLRGNNCLDCSMAAIATWHGEPTVAAPRTLDVAWDGDLNTSKGEAHGPERAEEWLGHQYERLGVSDGALAKIEQKLREGGPGSSAAIINEWNPDEGLAGAHAWNAFNDGGKVTWYDPQLSATGDRPIYRGSEVTRVWAICIDKDGNEL